jgi:HEAT repeat protein
MNANSFFSSRWCSLLAPVMIGLLLAGSGCSSEQTPSQGAQSTQSTGEAADVTTTPPAQITSDPAPALAPSEVAAQRGYVAEPLSEEDQVLLKQLSDPSPEVREEAAEDIQATGIALDALATLITTDPSPDVRAAAVYSLKESDDPGAVDVLILALDDKDPEVLEEVIDGLWFIGDKRALPHLRRFLDHPNEDVRDSAEYALENFN